MNCERIEALWARRLAGGLEEAEERDYASHLQGCEACRTRQAGRERALARFETLPRGEPSAAVWAGIEEKIGREMTRPPARSYAWLMPAWGVGIAAAVLAVVLMHPAEPAFFSVESAAGIVRVNGRDATAGSTLVPGDAVEAVGETDLRGPGGMRLELARGSRVRLFKDTVSLEQGTMEIECRAPARLETAGSVLVIDPGRAAITRSGRIEMDVRVMSGAARINAVEVAAGSWMGLVGGRPVEDGPSSAYDAFARTRDEAFESGRRVGRVHLASTPPAERDRLWRELSDMQEELVRAGGGRTLAALTAGQWEVALALAPAAAGEVRDALVEAFAEGAQQRLPAGWFFEEEDALPAAAERIKDAFVDGLKKILTPAQMAMAQRLMEDEDD